VSVRGRRRGGLVGRVSGGPLGPRAHPPVVTVPDRPGEDRRVVVGG
jgi:hypothetical protein